MESRERSSKGSVVVDVNKPKLRLRLPRDVSRSYFGVNQKYLSLGLDNTTENMKLAEFKAQQIENDLKFGQFDETLGRYRIFNHLSAVQTQSTGEEIQTATSVQDLWERYFEFKRSGLKPKTIEKYENFSRLFSKLPPIGATDALSVKEQLHKVTTNGRTKDALIWLSSACKWGMKHKLISSNPYDGMSAELPDYNYQSTPDPDAFTREERDHVIEAFKADTRPGMDYRKYAPFVEFLFLTGCRPSEAVGLRWKHISSDCGTVSFEGSIVQIGNTRVQVQGSKNNKTRTFSGGNRLRTLLLSMRPQQDLDLSALVFPGQSGEPINYRNFSRRAWQSVVNPIKPNTTPYNCRDTFITLQLIDGVPSAIIAKWCDTSTSMIDKNYADRLKLAALRPSE